MSARNLAILGLLLALGDARAQDPVQVHVQGAVAQPGIVLLQGAPRLADVAKQAGIDADAYVLGAAWLRPSLQPSQARLKAGLVYELAQIRNSAATRDPSLASLALQLRNWINAMPVTGRQVPPTLEPHAMQVNALANLPVSDGDTFFYPNRPERVSVVGAVVHACELPHSGLRDARDYATDCTSSLHADTDTVFVIEPDGRIFEQGIALWNRSPPIPVAPGAIVYVPLARHAIEHIADEAFNHEMAAFLATQPVGYPGVSP